MKSKEERQGYEIRSLSQSLSFIRKKLRRDRNVKKIISLVHRICKYSITMTNTLITLQLICYCSKKCVELKIILYS